MSDFEAVLAGTALRELPVAICLDGVASGELEASEAAFEGLGEWESTSMGDTNPAVALIGRIEAARARARAATVTFRFRAMGHLSYSRLLAAHPPLEGGPEGERYNAATFLPVLVERCCAEPVLSLPEVMSLLDRVNDGQARQLYGAALAVNEEPSPVPFS